MAKRTQTNPKGLPGRSRAHAEVPEILGGLRQPKRPHYLREWIERRHFKTDAEFAREIGADKSMISRWLDEDDPATPGKEWQRKLGIFFGDEENPADIFRHPDDDWFRKFFQDREKEEIERIKQTMETAFPKPRRSAQK